MQNKRHRKGTMENSYIICEPNNKQFREFSFNPDADCGMQIVEQLYSFELIRHAYKNSSNNEEFINLLDSSARTFLHDSGTTEFDAVEKYLKNLSSYTFQTKDRILMASLAMVDESTCKDCVHHARCEAVYEQIDSRSCKDDPVKDCDFFIHQSLIK